MPFVSTCGPIPYVHNTRARFRACRLVIIPDAVGHEHEVYPVGEDESFEDALPPHIRRWAAGLVEVA